MSPGSRPVREEDDKANRKRAYTKRVTECPRDFKRASEKGKTLVGESGRITIGSARPRPGTGTVHDLKGSARSSKLLVLVATSIAVRFLLFVLSIQSGMGFSIPYSEAWKDYAYAYVPTVRAFVSGYMPYRDFFHAYPPLFLYTLTLFSFLPSSWSMALPLVISDALTVVPVYLIGRRFLDERGAFVASILLALAPINLFYVDYLWLNPPLTTFFLMISACFLLQGRYDLSAVTLALSIGFKQTALVAVPIVLLFVAKKASRKGVLRYFLIVASICLAFSIPYIFAEPRLYLYSIFRIPYSLWPQVPENYFQLGFTNPSGLTTVGTATTTTLDWLQAKWTRYAAFQGGMTLTLPIFIFLLPEVSLGIYDEANLVLETILFAAYAFLLYAAYRREQLGQAVLVRSLLCSLLVLFTFNPVYKYYVVGITPFLSLLVQSRRDAIAFVIFNVVLLLIPRLLTPYLLLLLLGWLARHDLGRMLRPAWRQLHFAVAA
jgi:hypothetical protein